LWNAIYVTGKLIENTPFVLIAKLDSLPVMAREVGAANPGFWISKLWTIGRTLQQPCESEFLFHKLFL
jgi:hypothetical protein